MNKKMTKIEFIKKMAERYNNRFAGDEQKSIYVADCMKHLDERMDFDRLEYLIVETWSRSSEFPTVAEFLKHKSEVLTVLKSNEFDADEYKRLKETSCPPPPEAKQAVKDLIEKMNMKDN